MMETALDDSRVVASIQETREMVRQSTVLEKLKSRIDKGLDAEVLCADADGTIYVRGRGAPYIGKNVETTEQLADKQIPFIINTARPGWIPESDLDLLQNMRLPVPDAVIAGAGTMVYWRDKNGELGTDSVYFNRMEEHQVTMKRDGVEQSGKFDPETIIKFVYPTLIEFTSKGLAQILIDPGPIASDGRVGVGGIRLVAQGMTYEDVAKLDAKIRSQVEGVKIQLSEVTEMTTAEEFTGWLHLIPSIAGKDRALRYILEAMGQELGSEITSHVVGDTSIDVPMLAMGSEDKPGEYLIKQYAVSNLPARTREKLEAVERSLVNKDGVPGKHLHLTMLNEKGPDAVYSIVNNIK